MYIFSYVNEMNCVSELTLYTCNYIKMCSSENTKKKNIIKVNIYILFLIDKLFDVHKYFDGQ